TDYLVSHKGGTHEAVAAMGHLSESERQSIGEELYQHPFYVKVTSDGKATATFSDRALTQPAFDAIAKFANRVRYLPALADGKPVDGVAELRFSQLHL
ncbi:MAG TPA: hypothetical protein VHD32_04880, partial [Candidatus Didemnitutus sp.]|nr:hypothetical protein [Candidatus Didemnitutus sp.]